MVKVLKKEEQKSSNLCSKLQEGYLELHVTSDVDVAKKPYLLLTKGEACVDEMIGAQTFVLQIGGER